MIKLITLQLNPCIKIYRGISKYLHSILGEVLSETDALGNTTNYSYDALSRLTSVTNPLERVTSYVYDGADNIVTVIDANGNKVNYEYNTVGLLTKEADALGNVEKYKYYVDGLLELITKADGTTSTYAYDLAGRMTNVDYSDGTSITYGYNEVGSTTVMTDKTGTTTYQYDDMQRLISTTDSLGKTVSYEYDILGRKTSIILPPDGQATNYEYDVLDRLTIVHDGTDVLAEYGTRLFRTQKTHCDDCLYIINKEKAYFYHECSVMPLIGEGANLVIDYEMTIRRSNGKETSQSVIKTSKNLLKRVIGNQNGLIDVLTYDALALTSQFINECLKLKIDAVIRVKRSYNLTINNVKRITKK